MTRTPVLDVLLQRSRRNAPPPPPNLPVQTLVKQLLSVLPPPSLQLLCHRLLRIRILRSPTPLSPPTHPWIQRVLLRLYPTLRRGRNRRLLNNLPPHPLPSPTSMYLTRTPLSPPFRLSFPLTRWNSYPVSPRLNG